MAKDSWYTTNQMKLFAIKAPPGMVKLMNAEAANRDMTKRDYYRSVLVNFLPHADTVACLASYKSPDADILRFWMDKDIYDFIEEVSLKKRVSLSSVCYTAFFTHYQKLQNQFDNAL